MRDEMIDLLEQDMERRQASPAPAVAEVSVQIRTPAGVSGDHSHCVLIRPEIASSANAPVLEVRITIQVVPSPQSF